MSTPTESNNKRIAKNTGFLYFRMLFTMLVTFYTSRVVLNQLGVNDYGIYDVVGGLVSMFSLLSSSLTSAIGRFITYELGKGGKTDRLSLIFSTSMWIQILLALIILILIESIGLWFLNHKMVIAPQRLDAARWVLHCSALTFVVNMISVPYNAVIVAHEKMQAFAYISILEASLKLGVALLLYLHFFDNLIMYAVMLLLTSIIVRFTYSIYTRRHFSYCKILFSCDRGLIKEMLAFSGWNFIGSASAILRDQGVNVVMNLFFGTVINAARGIAMQIYRSISAFSQNFMMAVNPQIIKSYATGDFTYMFSLAFRSARFSYFLLYALSLPLILEMPAVLNLWLDGVVPEDAGGFSTLMLIFGLSESLSIPLQFVNHATGRTKTYQLTVGGLQSLNFPLAYILLKIGFAPYSVFILSIIISQICLGSRLLILRKSVRLNIRDFFKTVYLPVIMVSVIGCLLPLGFSSLMACNNWALLIVTYTVEFILSVLAIFLLGCNNAERKYIVSWCKKLVARK